MKLAALLLAASCLSGCAYEMSSAEVRQAARNCVERGGAVEVIHAGKYDSSSVIAVACYGDATPHVTYSKEHDRALWVELCSNYDRIAVMGEAGWTCGDKKP